MTSFRWIVAQKMGGVFPRTGAIVMALLPLLAITDANNEALPAGAGAAAEAAFNALLDTAGVVFQNEFNTYIQEFVLGIGWPAAPGAERLDR